jgi:hypothetical protein
MDPETVVKLIVNKGVDKVNLSMFSETERKAILQQVVEAYMRQGRVSDVLDILEHVDLKAFADRMRPVAEQCVELGEYKKAALIYEKIGYRDLSEFITENFVKA